MITEDFVSYEVAKLLKEKEFDELCIFKYNSEGVRMKAGVAIDEWQNSELDDDECSCVSHQMAMKWLREVHKIVINVFDEHTQIASPTYTFTIMDYTAPEWNEHIKQYLPAFREQQYNFNKYEDAVEAGIKYSLENLI